MLADDLIANGGSFDDRNFVGAFTALGERIKRAQRFDLSPEVMRSSQTIMYSAIDGQLRALALCRLPFAETWFEWPGNYSGEPSTRTDIHAPVPKRMGALVTTDESLQRGSIVFAWSHSFGCNICPLAMTFDWRADPEPLEDLTASARWHRYASDETWRAMAERFPRVARSSREALLDETRRFGVIYNPLCEKFLDKALRHPQADRLLLASIKDIEGEGPLVRATILLMNSRNLSERVPRDAPVKLNRARVKSGKRPLLDYTHVRIKLTRALAMRAAIAADPRAPSRLHLVSGHYKIRRTGVYWWSPHPRGHASRGEIKTQTRHVTV